MSDRSEHIEKLRDTLGRLLKIMAVMREEFPELEEIWEEAQAGSQESLGNPEWAHFDEFDAAGSDVLFNANLLSHLGIGIYAKCVEILSPFIEDKDLAHVEDQIKFATRALLE